MGFGTGLNAYLTYIAAQRLGLNISYHTIESHPVGPEIAVQLNYDKVLGYNNQDLLTQLHASSWDTKHQLSKQFEFTKFQSRIDTYVHTQTYDLIYYDAFAPSCQAELWTAAVHGPLYESLVKGGCLVTYCSQGQFKRTLKDLGYSLEQLNGPAKKREMIRANKL